ncbi:DUF6153 family protein [Actinomadura namibiensis]|uniref:Uncharacterized protein n=1 Tax=Actinomadura namibiensis TaxID=182080 RepID=A0A7W3LZU7_ACTNM|nr:DUF6153 family protein [Actinomadura namibiensis]MBA8957395.1 hypothetical protein [Actinomadura namibiensis]
MALLLGVAAMHTLGRSGHEDPAADRARAGHSHAVEHPNLTPSAAFETHGHAAGHEDGGVGSSDPFTVCFAALVAIGCALLPRHAPARPRRRTGSRCPAATTPRGPPPVRPLLTRAVVLRV